MFDTGRVPTGKLSSVTSMDLPDSIMSNSLQEHGGLGISLHSMLWDAAELISMRAAY